MRKPAAAFAAVTFVWTFALGTGAAGAAEGGLLPSAGGYQFLLGQFLTILGSVLGVYLASYVSFQRTLKYNRFVSAQRRAGILTAAGEELKQNIALLHRFNERLPAEVGTGVTDTEWPHLRLFVWQAAGHSAAVFDVPPEIMTGLQSVYEDVGEMLNEPEAHDSFRHLTASNTFYRTRFKDRLSAQLKLAETSVLPALQASAAKAKTLVAKYADPAESAQRL